VQQQKRQNISSRNAKQLELNSRMSPSILHPANMTSNHATSKSLFLLCNKDNSEIMTTSILHPANMMANHATSRSPFLLCNEDNSEIMTTSSLLLPFNQDNSAIMMATHAQNLLLFFV